MEANMQPNRLRRKCHNKKPFEFDEASNSGAKNRVFHCEFELHERDGNDGALIRSFVGPVTLDTVNGTTRVISQIEIVPNKPDRWEGLPGPNCNIEYAFKIAHGNSAGNSDFRECGVFPCNEDRHLAGDLPFELEADFKDVVDLELFVHCNGFVRCAIPPSE